MRLIAINNEIYLYELDSGSELNEHTKEKNGIIIGNNIQNKNKFYAFEFLINSVKNVVGVLNEGHGIVPHGIRISNENVMVLSSDKSVYFYNTISKEVVNEIQCDSLVYDVISIENEERILVCCELGIQSLTTKGDKVWMYDSDIIDDFILYENYMSLIINETEHKISLADGKEQ